MLFEHVKHTIENFLFHRKDAMFPPSAIMSIWSTNSKEECMIVVTNLMLGQLGLVICDGPRNELPGILTAAQKDATVKANGANFKVKYIE